MGSEIKMLYFYLGCICSILFLTCADYIVCRRRRCTCCTDTWCDHKAANGSGLTVSCLQYIPVQMLFQEHSFSLCSRRRFYKILPLFLRLLTNTCLITISTVPFPTSKCLLLPLLQLHFAMSYCERGTEATAHVWQLYSCCAEKHPSHSKLQP